MGNRQMIAEEGTNRSTIGRGGMSTDKVLIDLCVSSDEEDVKCRPNTLHASTTSSEGAEVTGNPAPNKKPRRCLPTFPTERSPPTFNEIPVPGDSDAEKQIRLPSSTHEGKTKPHTRQATPGKERQHSPTRRNQVSDDSMGACVKGESGDDKEHQIHESMTAKASVRSGCKRKNVAASTELPSASGGPARQEVASLLHEWKEEKPQMTGPYTLGEFVKMVNNVAADHNIEREEIEDSKTIRDANRGVSASDSGDQKKAQYGRILEKAGQTLLKDICCVGYWHVFCDIGHGIGNVCFQAAYTTGCEARGIEVVADRFRVSEIYRDNLKEQDKIITQRDGLKHCVGRVRLRHGQMECSEQREFLTKDVDVMFCNNFNDVFGHRATNTVGYVLDDYLAGLFCLLKTGACLITLCKLGGLPPSIEAATKIRETQGLPFREDASFYKLEEFEEEDGLNFTRKPFKIYKYTRTGPNKSTFLCCNPNCESARKNIQIKAWKIVYLKQDSRKERLVPVRDCPACGNSQRVMRPRRARKTK